MIEFWIVLRKLTQQSTVEIIEINVCFGPVAANKDDVRRGTAFR